MSHIKIDTGLPTYLSWTGTQGEADNAVVYLSGDVSDYDTCIIECMAGTVDVDVSLDGTNWITTVAARSLKATAQTTFVTSIASGGAIEIAGHYKLIRVLQAGATPSNARGAHAMNGDC